MGNMEDPQKGIRCLWKMKVSRAFLPPQATHETKVSDGYSCDHALVAVHYTNTWFKSLELVKRHQEGACLSTDNKQGTSQQGYSKVWQEIAQIMFC